MDQKADVRNEQVALFEDSQFNLISQIEKKSDFLYTSVEKYVRDAQKDGKPQLAEMWQKIKADEQKHLGMLKEELIREFRTGAQK